MSSDRFILIKAWSYTLWADIDHVLSQLLIAEITNRIPVIYWPTHCLHNGFVQTNGFELYFEPISGYTIYHIAKPEYTYYPPIWDSDSLLADDRDRDTWMYRNIGDIISSNANVVVGDAYYNVSELIPFVKKQHSTYGMTVEQTYHYLYGKYIKIKPDIEMEVQGYYNSWIKNNHPVLAVHVRRVDENEVFDARNSKEYGNQYWNKVYKRYIKKRNPEKIRRLSPKGRIKKPNGLYHSEIRKYVEKYNIKKIFLLTDCEETVKEYQKLYGTKLLFTDGKRIKSGDEASQMESPMIKRRRGIELIKDTYLAAKCDFFIGNDFSHLSHTALRIKDWGDKSVSLLYWLYKKLKYPINVKLIVKKESNNIIIRTIKRAIELFNEYKERLIKGGNKYAK
ncbi:GDP-fucose protein O-fucosyltransferase [Ruminiclostridium sufflavum DSM 19573]|uniref:GDP-fucose protein O-fucosyltransferase n=1 Tax=Ruminiclostridium sufflavum DSM 19573 TaxID=1121337 RepID=A0A318XGD4_9FIRM|nr:O-fucosyltransferase family protein [Ruminiclostridium sufflavum]PYG84997.1 GDP-fucose protein O-fucosyltransferase [Ruminiclostridium sufflavum DSM 19573]